MKLEEHVYICTYLKTTSGYIKARLMYCNHAGVPIKMSYAFPTGALDANNLKA